jgi:hypothetical protein
MRLEMSATPRHRIRLSARRLLRAHEMAGLLREVLAAIRTDVSRAIALGDWGNLLVESRPGSMPVDLHGLGEIAYRMLTGHLPGPGTRFVPGAPPPLATLILHMLADAGNRPTVQDAELAIAVMLGEIVAVDEPPIEIAAPAESFDVVDSFDDDEATGAIPVVAKRASDSAPNARSLRWTPPTHLAPAARAAVLPALRKPKA